MLNKKVYLSSASFGLTLPVSTAIGKKTASQISNMTGPETSGENIYLILNCHLPP